MTQKDQHNPADLAGAYALNALTPAEEAEFERYLEGSEEARVEAAELSDTAVALGLGTAPVQPSDALKARLMAQLSSTPQLPSVARAADPRTGGGATASGATGTTRPAGSDAGPAAPLPRAAEAPVQGGPSAGGPAEQRAARRWFQRPVTLVAAAAAAVALFFGGILVGQAFDGDDFERQQAVELADINAAPDAQRASTVTAQGQPATLVWSGKLGRSALLIENLPPLPDGKDYQLWYMNEEGAFSAGTFDSDGAGTVWRVLDGRMHAGDQVGVTVEPDGGSKEPTTDPIVAIQS